MRLVHQTLTAISGIPIIGDVLVSVVGPGLIGIVTLYFCASAVAVFDMNREIREAEARGSQPCPPPRIVAPEYTAPQIAHKAN